jgi:alkylation response protein AidB-like acyl-CoA dehydrogenase
MSSRNADTGCHEPGGVDGGDDAEDTARGTSMNLDYTVEQDELVDLARNVLGDLDTAMLKQQMESGEPAHSKELWRALADCGLLGLPFDPKVDGSGGTLFDLGLVFREMGRAVAPTTFASTMSAALLIDRLGSSAQRDQLLRRICTGEVVATIASSEEASDARLDLTETCATPSGDGWELNGTKAFVENAEVSEFVIATAFARRATSTVELFVVPMATAGVSVQRSRTLGQDIQNIVTFAGVRLPDDARLGVETPEPAADVFLQCRRTMDALYTMEMLGIAERVLEMTAAYVTERHQFGRPIGSFQAVQHAIADMAIAVTSGSPAAHRAAWHVSQGQSAVDEVAIANYWLGRACVDVTLAAHQLHGGIGFSLESVLYLYSQRAKVLELQCGSRGRQLESLAHSIFGPT